MQKCIRTLCAVEFCIFKNRFLFTFATCFGILGFVNHMLFHDRVSFQFFFSVHCSAYFLTGAKIFFREMSQRNWLLKINSEKATKKRKKKQMPTDISLTCQIENWIKWKFNFFGAIISCWAPQCEQEPIKHVRHICFHVRCFPVKRITVKCSICYALFQLLLYSIVYYHFEDIFLLIFIASAVVVSLIGMSAECAILMELSVKSVRNKIRCLIGISISL